MGLDMYLQGHQYFGADTGKKIDDFRIKEIIVELGYWRKHPNLHGAIITAFADGKDECQIIELSLSNIEGLISMVEADNLPFTQGFFFGQSATPKDSDYNEQKQNDINILQNVLKWYSSSEIRWVTYRASW